MPRIEPPSPPVAERPEGGHEGGRIDWGSVYREMYGSLVRYLRLKLWDGERAAELAQDVFVRALGTAPQNPRAWLFTVAANLAHDEARQVVRRKRHLALLERAASADPPAIDPLAAMEREQRAESVRRALDMLGERDREVLLLRDAGLSYPEIAERTGLAIGAIGTTLSRARKRLVDAHASLNDGIPRKREEAHAARG